MSKIFLFSFLLALVQPVFAVEPVVDEAQVFTPTQTEQLKQDLIRLKEKKDVWLVVLTVPTLGGASVEEFANQKFKNYKIGNAKGDNGLLLVLAMNDRKMRLEVGYGLEGSLTDAETKRLLDDNLRPYMKQGKTFEGVSEVIKTLTARDYTIQYKSNASEFDNRWATVPTGLVLFLVFTFFFKRLLDFFVKEEERDYLSRRDRLQRRTYQIDVVGSYEKFWRTRRTVILGIAAVVWLATAYLTYQSTQGVANGKGVFAGMMIAMIFIFLVVVMVPALIGIVSFQVFRFVHTFLFRRYIKYEVDKTEQDFIFGILFPVAVFTRGRGRSTWSSSDSSSSSWDSSSSSSSSSSSDFSGGGSSGGGGASSDW